MKSAVHLGFAVPSGDPVEIPVRHMAITGQTQEAGKTTALEALIDRSGMRAVTFITKRGEGSFANARRVDPYFREQSDWQFVASILEASRGEKLKFERAWIIRASKGTRTLADVHANVRRSLADPKTRGMSADVYLTLDAYLEAVVPVISSVRWAQRLELAAGVNAVDLTDVPMEMQHLVIKSTLDWVLDHEENTVVVIPEAWKFVPEGRGTPVKRSAMALIRQGAGLKNYVWLDSQDIGGVDKEVLRSVPVWILGVQREANEIKRTLSNIPAGTAKPKASDIATLDLGQFFACWKTNVIRTYVQPTWLRDDAAALVAQGRMPIEAAIQLGQVSRQMGAVRKSLETAFSEPKEKIVNEIEAQKLRDDNVRLSNENGELRRRLDALERRPSAAHIQDVADKIKHSTVGAVDGEAMFQFVKARLIDEAPGLIRLLASGPEIEVTVTRKTLTMEEDSLKGRMAILLKNGFFSSQRGPSSVRTELRRTGADANTANISRALNEFKALGFLVGEDGGYVEVPGMKVNVVTG